MASDVEICNWALGKLGASRITSLTEGSVNARACNAIYTLVRDGLLRAYAWNFAIKRRQLPQSVDSPPFGGLNAFPLPSDYIQWLRPDAWENPNDLDWKVEGQSLLTTDAAPLNLRYVSRITDPSQFDPLFVPAFAAKLARELCELLTQSNSKKADCAADFKDAIAEAKKQNAIEKVPARAPVDNWITRRL